MIEIPKPYFFDGFYIWFDKEKRVEYFSTPLYFYYADRKNATIENETTIYLQKDISSVKPSKKSSNDILKHPATFLFPYKERFGDMLIRFLNTDFSTFESSYNNFFYAYGFELIKDNAPYNGMLGRYNSEFELVEVLKKTFENAKDVLYGLQYEYKEFVNYLYNLNGNEELKNHSAYAKFVAYMIKHKGAIADYSYNIDVFRNNYSNKELDYTKLDFEELVQNIDNDLLTVPITNIYTSKKLSNILYVILEEIILNGSFPIKTCQNCGNYFIPTTRIDEIYCDFPNINGLNCREQGAGKTYRQTIKEIPALLEYRRSYQKKAMFADRNKDNKQLRKDFEIWRKEAQDKIKLYKKGKLAEKDLYDWIMGTK
jgi:hypothetical protein